MNKYQMKIALWGALDSTLPFNLVKRVDRYRRYFFYKKHGAIFIHIPKAAGSSVTASLYGRRLGHHKASDVRAEMPTLYQNLFTFAFVRNPWSRLYSSYKYAVNQGGSHGGIKAKDIYNSQAFSSFKSFVLNWLPSVDLSNEDPVFRTQSSYLYEANDLLVDYVGRVESFNESLIEISNISGITLEEINMNRSKDNKESYLESYTAEMVKVVSQVYAEDIKRFNYTFDDGQT
jgi:hypothetical protein